MFAQKKRFTDHLVGQVDSTRMMSRSSSRVGRRHQRRCKAIGTQCTHNGGLPSLSDVEVFYEWWRSMQSLSRTLGQLVWAPIMVNLT